jgi:hypothetical protein
MANSTTETKNSASKGIRFTWISASDSIAHQVRCGRFKGGM